MREKLGKAFNLTKEEVENMNYVDFYYYADILKAEDFEGIPKRVALTNEDWYFIRLCQRHVLAKAFDEKAT